MHRRGVQGLTPPWMRTKPAACSKALGPRRGTLSSSPRSLKGPLVSRWATMFWARAGPRPETAANSWGLAVFTSTPTEFTQLTTTSSRLRESWP